MDAVRVANRVVSALLALALAVLGVLVAVEVVLAALDRDPWLLPHDEWRTSMLETAWGDRSAVVTFLVVAVIGVALLLLELARRRMPAVKMAARTDGVSADLDRHGVERWLASRLSSVEGATSTRAKIRSKTVDVTAATPQRDTSDVRQRLERAAQDHLDELDLGQRLKARARVSSRRGS